MEERLGANIFAWIGGVAMLLAGAFFVKYSFDQGLLSPMVRIVLGSAFGVVMVMLGVWLGRRSPRVAEALTGAGIADLYACLLAAVNLYDLIGRTTAFGLMIALTGLAIALALRQGMFVAVLGLIGGFITPALIGSQEPAAGPLFVYLLLLEVALIAVAARRGWVGLSMLALVAGIVWAAVFTALQVTPDYVGRFWVGAFVLGTATAYVIAATRFTETTSKIEGLTPLRLGLAATAAAPALLAMLAAYGGFALWDFAMIAMLGAGTIILARLDRRYLALPWIAAAVTGITLLAWRLSDEMNHYELIKAQAAWLTLGFGALYTLGAVCVHLAQQAGAWVEQALRGQRGWWRWRWVM